MSGRFVRYFKEYGMMAAGCVIYSLSLALLLDPNELAPGGVSGISVIVSRLVPMQVGTLILLFNIPIMLLGFMGLGKGFCLKSLLCLGVTSGLMNWFSANLAPVTDDKVLAALWGGGLLGLGIGLVMKQRSSTGGMDIVIKLLRRKFPQMKTSALYLALDAVIVLAASVVFRDISLAMYAGITVYVSAHVMDLVLYGRDEAKLIYVISDEHVKIARQFLQHLEIGVTYIEGAGAYSRERKQVIMAVLKKHMMAKAEEVIKAADPNAFLIITSATEIYGEGYKNLLKERL